MYTRTCDKPGATPIAWAMSNTCSVSSQAALHIEEPSSKMLFTGTLFLTPMLVKY